MNEMDILFFQPQSIQLPIPTSTNALYKRRKDGGVFRTQEYKDFIEEVGWTLIENKIKPLPEKTPLYFIIDAKVPRHIRDLDNCQKALLDSFQRQGIIKDDKWIDALAIYRNVAEQLDARINVRFGVIKEVIQ